MLEVTLVWGTPGYGFTWYWRPRFFFCNLKRRTGVEVRWLLGTIEIDWYRAG